MSIGYSDIWVGGGVDQGWVGTVLPKVLLRWMPSRLSPLVVVAVSDAAAAAAAADDDDDGGGGGDDDDDDDENDNDDNYDDDDDAFFRDLKVVMMLFFRDLEVASRTSRTTPLALEVSAEQSVGNNNEHKRAKRWTALLFSSSKPKPSELQL